jgi:hypothetical protein
LPLKGDGEAMAFLLAELSVLLQIPKHPKKVRGWRAFHAAAMISNCLAIDGFGL